MRKRIGIRGIVCLLLAALALLVCLAGCAKGTEGGEGGTSEGDLSRFENARLGVVTGSLYGGYSRALFPNASVSEFNNFADVLGALIQGKVDGAMLDLPNFNSVKRTESGLSCTVVPEYSVEIGFGFQKNGEGDGLKAKMNAFLARLKAEGTLYEMLDKWYGETEPAESVPLGELSSEFAPLSVSVDMTRKPFVYMYNNEPVGFEIEVLYLFCKEYGCSVSCLFLRRTTAGWGTRRCSITFTASPSSMRRSNLRRSRSPKPFCATATPTVLLSNLRR